MPGLPSTPKLRLPVDSRPQITPINEKFPQKKRIIVEITAIWSYLHMKKYVAFARTSDFQSIFRRILQGNPANFVSYCSFGASCALNSEVWQFVHSAFKTTCQPLQNDAIFGTFRTSATTGFSSWKKPLFPHFVQKPPRSAARELIFSPAVRKLA